MTHSCHVSYDMIDLYFLEKGDSYMNLLVIEKHDGEGVFPLFKKGAAVSDLKEDNEYPVYPHWLSCVIDGYETYIPEIYVVDGILNQDYNPTELIVEKGQKLVLIDIVFSWLYVKDENNKEGWLPASKVISIKGD